MDVEHKTAHYRRWCQGTTCFLLQKHLEVFPTPTSDTFGILRTLTTSEFQRHFGVLLIPSPFQQSPTLLCTPSTPTPCPTPPPKITPRPPPPPKVARKPLRTPYPPIRTPLRCSSETLQVVAEIRQLPWHLILMSGDELFSTPKLSRSFANSNLRHLQHSLDPDCPPVPETLWSTSYSKPLPAVPNTTAYSFHSNPLPNTPSKGCSEGSTSSKGDPETSSDSAPSNPKSGPTFFGNSLSHSGDRAAPTASNIKGQVIKVICNVKGRW